MNDNSSLMVSNNKVVNESGQNSHKEEEVFESMSLSQIMTKFKQMRKNEVALTSELKKQRKITDN